MKFFSTNNRSHQVSFEEAIFRSLPPDNGLYYPTSIPTFPKSFFDELKSKSKSDVALTIATSFIEDEIPEHRLAAIVEETIDFDVPLVQVDNHISALELFHGPTWAFKDMGARFLSRCMGYFTEKRDQEIDILVATSGDTGGAVAAGFYQVPGIRVTILYPKGKVSELQQQQLTTWGENIHAIEIDGTFDDCQKLVKTAFLDNHLQEGLSLSSANSINIARLIPQSFYYFFAFQQLASWEHVVVSVPSGNYGNLTAGLLAYKMGLPIKRFIAASNINKIVPDYLETGSYRAKPSIETYANAMDVGDPSNFVRMDEFFSHDVNQMRKMITGFSLADDSILETMRSCRETNGYILDPHGAIGFRALQEQLIENEQGIFLETAHPVKFLNVLEKAFSSIPNYSEKIDSLKAKPSNARSLSNSYSDFKEYLITK